MLLKLTSHDSYSFTLPTMLITSHLGNFRFFVQYGVWSLVGGLGGNIDIYFVISKLCCQVEASTGNRMKLFSALSDVRFRSY